MVFNKIQQFCKFCCLLVLTGIGIEYWLSEMIDNRIAIHVPSQNMANNRTLNE